MPSKEDIRTMIDQIATGDSNTKAVVDSFMITSRPSTRSPLPPSTAKESLKLKCTNSGCDYESGGGFAEGTGYVQCPKCRSAVIESVEEVYV